METLLLLVLLSMGLVNSFNTGQLKLSREWCNTLSTNKVGVVLPSRSLILSMAGTSYQPSSRTPYQPSSKRSDEVRYDVISDMVAEADAIFDSIDVNKDGGISNDELQTYLEKNGYSEYSIRNLFTAMDKNADGVISREEMQFAFSNFEATALFMAFGEGSDVSADAYNDAVKAIRSSAEIENNLPPELLTKLADLIFDMIDTDKSGEIDTQELKDFFREAETPSYREIGNASAVSSSNIFRALDLDTNSKISREEMREGFKLYDPRVLSKAFGLRVARTSEM